jgi:hypothetical protein
LAGSIHIYISPLEKARSRKKTHYLFIKQLLFVLIFGSSFCFSGEAKCISNTEILPNPSISEVSLLKESFYVTDVKKDKTKVPECTVTTKATYSASFLGCDGNPTTASSTKTRTCTGSDCTAAYVCASISAWNAAMADVNSVHEPCF